MNWPKSSRGLLIHRASGPRSHPRDREPAVPLKVCFDAPQSGFNKVHPNWLDGRAVRTPNSYMSRAGSSL
jgi:hypothetical protein